MNGLESGRNRIDNHMELAGVGQGRQKQGGLRGIPCLKVGREVGAEEYLSPHT